jgi:hypothetical protein
MVAIEFHVNGWFYRYDSYLMAIGIFAISINIYYYIPGIYANFKRKVTSKYLIFVLFIVVLSPLLFRSLTIFEIPFAMNNIYDQHFQMSKFIRQYYDNSNIAARYRND